MSYAERLNIECPKPKRFPIGKAFKKNSVLTQHQIRYILMGKVIVEEKMDGKPVKFGSTDPQLFIFAEDLKQMHSVFYHIPGRYAIYDIFNPQRDVFLSWEEKQALSLDIRKGKIKIASLDSELFFPIPMIADGKYTLEELPNFLGISAYARKYGNVNKKAFGEGIVVKSGAEAFPEEYYTGKIVRKEFLDGIITNYLREPYKANAIDPSVKVITDLISTLP